MYSRHNMRVRVISNAWPPFAGGAAVIAKRMADGLAQRGMNVDVSAPKISWFQASAPVRLWYHVCDLVRSTVARDIRTQRADVVITHNLTGIGWNTGRIAQRTGAIWIHVLHDVQLFEPSGAMFHNRVTLWQRTWSALRRRAFGRPDIVVSPTQWLIDAHRERGWFRHIVTRVIPNPAPAWSAEHMPTQASIQRLLYVGRISFEKGSDLLVKLAKRLPNSTELHLIGEGDASDFAACNNVVCHGVQSQDVIREQMRRADVLLFPSRLHENQPTVLLEAACMGLPVIAHAVGGVTETLHGIPEVCICPVLDVEAWLTRIEQMRSGDVQTQVRNALAHIAKRHRAEDVAEAWFQLVSELASRNT